MTRPRFSRREALVAAGLVGGGFAIASLMRAAAPLARDVAGNSIAEAALVDPDGPSGGAADADLVMAAFTDYRCPACRRAHLALREAMAADGKVQLIYKDYPIFGRISKNAAALALAAHTQGLYEPLHHRMMTGPATVDTGDIRAALLAIGGNWRRLLADARDPAIAARLARIGREAFGLGLAGTPSYLIGTRLVIGGLDSGQFRRVFREARAAA